MAQIRLLVAYELSQKVILALEIVRLLLLMKIEKEIPSSGVSSAGQALPSCMEWAPSQRSPPFVA